MPKVRLGVALLVPAPIDREVDALRRACDDGALGRIPAHITLVPPVNVRDDRMMDALDVVRAAAASTRPFTVRLGPVVTFHPVNPVLYLAATGEGIRGLRDRVFRPPLERQLSWPFVPHVTLAEEMAPDRIEAAVRALAGYWAEVTFERVHLLQEGGGRVWRPIADAALEAPAVIGRGGLPLELSVTAEPDLEATAFAEREWPVHDFAEFGGRYEARHPFAITARRESAVVGLADGYTGGGVTYLAGLIVGAAHRGQGVGSHLMAAVESLAAERGCGRLALRTPAGSRAEGFYRARGWVEEGRLSPWRFGRETVLFRRDL